MTVVIPGRFPGVDWRPSVNFWPGHTSRKAVVIHINQGSFDNSIKYMAENGTSAHFEVGKKGKLAQMVDVNDSAWCNGLTYNGQLGRWVCPHEHVVTPTWQLLAIKDGNPNRNTISIENEGFSGVPWLASQFDANVKLLVWLGGLFPSLLPYSVGSTLIGHFHLDPRDKGGCPGSGVDLHRLAEVANAALGLDQLWRKQWGAKGVGLPEEQIGWGIPQAYKPRAAELGACLAGEVPLAGGVVSVAVFERGIIYYVKATGISTVELFAKGG